MSFIFLFIVGLCIGSFLNVVIDRLAREESLFGRSYCESCKKKLNSLDLIPLLSFLFLKGKCRYCKARLELWYPVVELTTGVMFVASYQLSVNNYELKSILILLLGLIITSCLIAIFFADIKYGIIPDGILIVLIPFTFLFLILNSSFLILHSFTGICALLFFLTLFLVTKGRGIGFGDVKYAFFMGLFLGFPSIISGLYVAFLTGAVVSFILVLIGRKKLRGSTIAFGPFLVLGTFVAWFWGVFLLEQFFRLV